MRTTLALVLLLGSANLALAQNDPPTLQGVWGIVIQQRDCATDAPIGPPFRALTTYENGGTLTDSAAAAAFQPGQRSIAHGTWSKEGRRYHDKAIAMIVFETAAGTPPGSPGFQAGWQVAEHWIRLTSQNTFTATGVSNFYTLNREVYRTSCSTRTGERLQ